MNFELLTLVAGGPPAALGTGGADGARVAANDGALAGARVGLLRGGVGNVARAVARRGGRSGLLRGKNIITIFIIVRSSTGFIIPLGRLHILQGKGKK